MKQRLGHAARAVAREPLVQFLLLGLLLFLVAGFLDERSERRAREIVIDRAQVDYLRNLHQAQFGSYPDERTLGMLIDNHVRDEALYREAQALGLAADDEIIRRRLVSKMEFLLTDTSIPPEPDDAALQAFLADHAGELAGPARVRFRHLYFADQPDRNGGARSRAAAMLLQLSDSGSAPVSTDVRADEFPLGNAHADLEPADAVRLFGRTELADALFTAPVGAWCGPFRSGYGWHLLLIEQRHDTETRPLNEIRDDVREAWLREQRSIAARATADRLIAKYRIVRPDPGDAP